jgi:hypothetical protein
MWSTKPGKHKRTSGLFLIESLKKGRTIWIRPLINSKLQIVAVTVSVVVTPLAGTLITPTVC